MAEQPTFTDDKSPHCIPFIKSLYTQHASTSSTPFFIGLNGVQGAGKTTLVTILSNTLSTDLSLPVLVLSIDDLYLPRPLQLALSSHHPSNRMLQHRGQPGTHDIALARTLFSALKAGREVKIPAYDKSLHNGQGDRVPESRWRTVNKPGEKRIEIIIFEGWCVGFQALSREAVEQVRDTQEVGILKKHTLESLLEVNTYLSDYTFMNEAFDAFVHLDAERTEYVYVWRREQEAALRRNTGRGMSETEVDKFVDGYYPAYELYTSALREGLFKNRGKDWKGRQLRMVLGRNRKVTEVVII